TPTWRRAACARSTGATTRGDDAPVDGRELREHLSIRPGMPLVGLASCPHTGERKRMLKLTFVLRRLRSLSREEFQRYWWQTHGPLVRRHAAALRIRRYVQVHTLDDPLNAALRESRGAEEGYDGVAELWSESRADLEAVPCTAD